MPPAFTAHSFVTSDGLALHYRDYITGAAPPATPVVCLHGLTRNCEDFDELAPRLARTRRLLTIDMRGRGDSQYDPEPMHYHPGQYASDVCQWLDQLQLQRAIVVGTSMGGLIAMRMAHSHPGRLTGVVLNDVGPEIGPAGAARLMTYVGRLRPPLDRDQARANTRLVLGSALPGVAADAPIWDKLTDRTYRQLADGSLELKSDPAIGQALAQGAGADAPDLWAQFAALGPIPVLCLRGEHSDILSAETVAKMKALKPDLVVHTVARRGHAPLLDEADALAAIEAFLEKLP